MKRTSFFAKLMKKGKLQIVEPSEEIKASYLKKSESYLKSAKILLTNDRVEESVSLTYYSMYYSLLALLFKAGIKCENHSAAIILLKTVFGMDNSEISTAKKDRISKQYYVDFSLKRSEVEEMIKMAENFNSRLFDFIERLNKESTEKFRKIMESLLK